MITRRKFLQSTTLASVGAFVWSCTSKRAEGAFSPSEKACLIAFCEQIIPADEKYGGATDARVINFISNWVTDYFPEREPFYHKAIACMQKSCNRMHKKDFQDLAFAEQTEFLKNMEVGKLDVSDWQDVSQQNFFNEILTRTMQGFYGSPRHGGNKDYMSWQMLGLSMPHVLGQNRYEERKI